MGGSFVSDYQWGVEKETEVFNIIQPLVGESLKRTEKHNTPYDFKDDFYFYEVKARRCVYKQYPTTLLPKNKVFTDRHYFFFYFIDGLYFIRYDADLFKTFEIAPFQRFQRINYNDKVALYYHIPIDRLQPLSDFRVSG